MKTIIWQKKKMTIYIGGDPAKNQAPEFTIEIESPQIQMDSDKNIIIISETR